MTKTFKFTCTEDGCHYTVIVKKEFFDICPCPHLYTGLVLTEIFNIRDFLHCVTGPAVVNHTLNNNSSYWINGMKCYTKAIWEELVEKIAFDKKIETLVNEGEHYGTS